MIYRKHIGIYGIAFVCLFLLDRITKWLALILVSVPYQMTKMITFDVSLNRGISWGMFNQESTTIFIGVSVIVGLCIMAFVWYTIESFQRLQKPLGQVMVLAGALSNFVDRFVYGGVVDFIYVSYGSWHWPSFNCADACIVIGVAIMLIRECYYVQPAKSL